MFNNFKKNKKSILIIFVVLILGSFLSIILFRDNLGRDFAPSYMIEFIAPDKTEDDIKNYLNSFSDIDKNYDVDVLEYFTYRIYNVEANSFDNLKELINALPFAKDVKQFHVMPIFDEQLLYRFAIISTGTVIITIFYIFLSSDKIKKTQKTIFSVNIIISLIYEGVILSGLISLLTELFGVKINYWSILVITSCLLVNLFFKLSVYSIHLEKYTNPLSDNVFEKYQKFLEVNSKIIIYCYLIITLLLGSVVLFTDLPVSLSMVVIIFNSLLALFSTFIIDNIFFKFLDSHK